jgi:hypothetical protein
MTTEEAKVEVPVAEAAATVSTEAVDDVVERLRFFFSDANVRQDYFIRKLLLSDQGEYSHQVLVESLLRFNTIKQHTTDEAVVIAAAKKLSDKLVVSDDNKAIGRVKPFTLELMDDNIPLTLYVNNIPMVEDGDKKKYTVGADDIRKLFEPYGRVVLLKLRFKRAEHSDYDDDDLEPQTNGGNRRPAPKRRHPLGAALVEFEDAESLDKAAADILTSKDQETVEPKQKLMLGETQLEVCMLKDYIDARKKLKVPKATKEASADAGDKPESKTASRKRELEEKLEGVEFKMDWKAGCVIRVKGLPLECDREAILEGVAKAMDSTVDEVKEKNFYVDYSRGQTDGAIRLPEPTDDVKNICDKLKEGTVEIAGTKVETAFVLEGEEETKYWTEFIDFKTKQMRHRIEEKATRNSGNKRGGSGGRGGGGRGGGGRGNYGHSNKRQKNDNW